MRARTIALAVALLAPAPAAASSTQESLFQDDPRLIYSSDQRVDETLGQLQGLGVDRVRITLLWRNLAPEPAAAKKPANFDATDSNAYPDGVWDAYDRVLRIAERHGIAVLMNPTGPAPTWATSPSPRETIQETYVPDRGEFRDFVAAAGKRYSGTFRPGGEAPAAQQPSLLPGILPAPRPQPDPAAQAAAARPLPRVDAWSIWNEPNHPSWLTPQWVPDVRGGRRPLVAAAPALYRNLADAAWKGLAATGHEGDTILLGETAPRGWSKHGLVQATRPLEFVREMFCLSPRLRPYQGGDAVVRGCPSSLQERAGFAAAHPGLFRVTGFAHHPYRFDAPPAQSDPIRDNVPLADIGRLHTTLSAAYRRWGQGRRTPVWFTEYGYQTSPPDPFGGVSWRRQASYLSQASFIAYRDPLVASMAQFLLVDDAPRVQFSSGDKRHWATFQTGLLTLDGKPKTALTAYERTVWLDPPVVKPRGQVTVFGQYKPAAQGARIAAQLQFRPAGSRRWAPAGTLVTGNPRGFFRARTRVRAQGSYRLRFADPATGAVEPSLPAQVRLARTRP